MSPDIINMGVWQERSCGAINCRWSVWIFNL